MRRLVSGRLAGAFDGRTAGEDTAMKAEPFAEKSGNFLAGMIEFR